MSEAGQKFDWLGFFARTVGVVVLTILWIRESLRKHDQSEAITAAIAGFVVLPALAYLWTRYRVR